MKKIFISIIIIISFINATAQNVGIGTATPAYKLDLAGRLRIQNTANTAGIWFDGLTMPVRSFIGTMNDDHVGISGSGGVGWNLVMNVNNGNVGIGELAPAHKLDLNGRMRIQHNTNSSAGIWFDGYTTPLRSFIGTVDENHVGIWGNGGVGWNIAMNVINGNTGIGTSAPTAKLDVNGTIRIRNSSPKKGSVLTSDDTNGNASWADPVAFKASGINSSAMGSSVPLNSWTKFYFETVAEYNLGLAYQPNNSQFVALEDGIYHLNAQVGLIANASYSLISIRRQRSGVNTIIAQSDNGGAMLNNSPQYTGVLLSEDSKISIDVKLLAGDILWIETLFTTPLTVSYFPYSSNNEETWFSGHLVARL